MSEKQSSLQLIWGIALALAGVGVFFRIPRVIPPLLGHYDYFAAVKYFVYFVCYLLATVLIIGGGRKIYAYYRAPSPQPKDNDS